MSAQWESVILTPPLCQGWDTTKLFIIQWRDQTSGGFPTNCTGLKLQLTSVSEVGDISRPGRNPNAYCILNFFLCLQWWFKFTSLYQTLLNDQPSSSLCVCVSSPPLHQQRFNCSGSRNVPSFSESLLTQLVAKIFTQIECSQQRAQSNLRYTARATHRRTKNQAWASDNLWCQRRDPCAGTASCPGAASRYWGCNVTVTITSVCNVCEMLFF